MTHWRADERVAVFPPKDSGLGFESWAREMASLARTTLDPPQFPDQPLPRGQGRTVLLIPGFLSGDWSMARLAAFLRSLDYRVETARVFFNPGPTAGMVARLDETMLRLAKNGPIHIVGQSLGGVLARHLARRHPDKVCRVVTLCSPIRFPVTTPLEPFTRLLKPFLDPKWVRSRHEIAMPLPVPVTAIYSPEDGIVDWRQCLQDDAPGAENVLVRGTHSAMGSNPKAQIVIALALGKTLNA
jgi:hypothetical protein